ncbi:MAG: hypothetical protein ACRCT2_01775 [Plesiomonas shigelloides]
MTLASGNVINRENLQGVSYPFGNFFLQTVGYLLIDPLEPPSSTLWVYEDDQALPEKERSRLKVKLPKGLRLYLYGVAVPRGVLRSQTQTLQLRAAPIIYTPDPITGEPVETGIGLGVAFQSIPIAPILTKIYDPIEPLSEASASINLYPLAGMDAGSVLLLTEDSYLQVTTGSPILLNPEIKTPMRIAVVVAGWMKDPRSVSIDDIGGWSTRV